MEKDRKPLPQLYHDVISSSIDAGGVHPHQAIAISPNDRVTMYSLDLPPHQAWKAVRETIRHGVKELIYGLDRYAKDGQGTTLNDLIAGAHYAGGLWRPFIIEYQHEPRRVLPIDWLNPHWSAVVSRELSNCFMGASIVNLLAAESGS